MTKDPISEIRIDAERRLCIKPQSASFPYVYREAMEVNWDSDARSLNSPAPREWSYARWFSQIVDAARAQGVELLITERTQWIDVPAGTKAEILTQVDAQYCEHG
ncbi:MAG: hypothetical protein JSS42_08370 [Proteobacteria bacterium]|nr:hypothetical protein [Pseudomonadota bacterium]